MTSSSAPALRPGQVRMHLERALEESTDPEVRFHLRQALQMVV